MQVSHTRPKLVKRVRPEYPAAELKRKIQGQVILDAITDKYGNVRDVHVVDGVPELNKAALEAVKQWKYELFVSDGKPRAVRFTVIVHFNLPKDVEEKLGEEMAYTGELMDFHFENADIHEVLIFIIKKIPINIVVDPGIEGKVTVSLYNVHWDQALDLLLQVNSLDMHLQRKVLKIFKQKKVLMEETEAEESAAIPNILPLRGYLKDVFGYRKDFRTNKMEFHSGIDIAAKMGAEVVAPAGGYVLAAESRKEYGKLIIIDHGFGYTTRYAELFAFKVKKGDRVKRNQVIGLVGNSGNKGEHHLHYEVRYKDKPVNPMTVIRGR